MTHMEHAMNLQPEFADLFALPPAERLQLVEDLWDSLIPEEASLPVAEWVTKELKARKAEFDANPASGLTWAEVVSDLDKD
jgi:putative addiction module component (TIGR02574 family)